MNSPKAYKRKDGRWECRCSIGKTDKGNTLYKSFYGKTKEESENKMMAYLRLDNDDNIILTEMMVSELLNEWLSVTSVRIKESTMANYTMKASKHIIPYFGNIKCCMLKAKDVYAFIENKLKSGLSLRYISDIIVMLKSVFRYASREYNIRNTLDSVSVPKYEKSEITILSHEDQKKLMDNAIKDPSYTNLGIAVTLNMGLRIGELCALKWADIDLEERILTVRKTMQRIQTPVGESKTKVIITIPKSHNSIRKIPIPDCIIEILRQNKSENNNFVLSGTSKPIEPRTMQYRFAKILKNVNLPSVKFHSLRHAFASGAVELGFDIKTLSEILGHSSIQITLDLYVHSSMERKRACMDKMAW